VAPKMTGLLGRQVQRLQTHTGVQFRTDEGYATERCITTDKYGVTMELTTYGVLIDGRTLVGWANIVALDVEG